ncbi:glycosyl transferase family 51 [Ktedonosporobacter rubrisoli]|uniref:Glycosyl transferase family 51 n=1 Tax=Ktedonosporobacter rubrisoli TaxID=2509675 RepID=A0A4P6JVC0_KTERU|nr:transglycosylase domain-containing protein [Ktedonosporobacter rubrisoli]QBD79313.1 glycosyl transferase family 51 [Ktedonosporobacter rubrisoli]
MNNWDQPPDNNYETEFGGPAPASGLLSGYRQQHQQFNQPPSAAPAMPQEVNPYSPMPPGPYSPQPSMPQQPPPQQMPPAGSWQDQQNWFANTRQMVQRFSGKIAAIGRQNYQQSAPPMNGFQQQSAPPMNGFPPQAAPPMNGFQQSAPPMNGFSPQGAPPMNGFQQPMNGFQQQSAPPMNGFPPQGAPPMNGFPPGQGPSGPLDDKQWKRSRSVRLSQKMRQKRESRHPRARKIVLGIIIGILAFIVVATSAGGVYAYSLYQTQLPRLQGLATQQITQTTHITDRNGVPLANLFPDTGRRTPVMYKDIPQVMQDAMIGAEDPSFWTNSGIDPQGIVRAAVEYLQHHAIAGGGSTLTQQIIKNLTGDARQTPDRKAIEAVLATGLTQQYPKSKILEMYFNIAGFGAQDLGIESAVEDYFHLMPQCDKNFNCVPGIKNLDYDLQTKKHDPYLGLARASLLAAMPQNPVIYDPTLGESHRQAALGRQDYVLKQMMTKVQKPVDGIGPITPAVIQKVEQMTAKMKFTGYQPTLRAPQFVQWVKVQLATALGHGNYSAGLDAVLSGGFNVRTTLDANLEDYVERAVKRHLTQPEFQYFPTGHYATLNQDNRVNDAAVVVMNARDGEVLAMDGSLDYNFQSNDEKLKSMVSGKVNMALQPRQPGSTFKPIVYATAFQMGWYPGIILPDSKTYFPNGLPAGTDAFSDATGVYKPTDYSAFTNQNMTVRKATAMSLNVPAVKAMTFVGKENVANTAHLMGINGSFDDQLKGCGSACVSMVLGSLPASLLQMTGAYQTFANQGTHVPPQGIIDIWDNYGHHLYHLDPNNVKGATRVFSPQVSYMMTSVLADEHARTGEFLNDHDLSFWDWDPTCGYRSYAPYPDCQIHQVAAKTGTTDQFVDNWTIGYTPDVVVGVWAGNADNTTMVNVSGVSGAGPIWHSVMERVNGHCNVANDDVPCGDINFDQLNFKQTTFTQPPGLHVRCVSPMNGLQAQGDTGNCDWVLDGQDPMQSGFVATNNDNQNNDNNGDNNDNTDINIDNILNNLGKH